MCRLCANQIPFGTPDFLLGAPHGGIRAGKFGGQLGNLQNGERLTCLHMVADIHVNHFDVAGDFGVNVDILKWLEFPGDCERIPHVVTL